MEWNDKFTFTTSTLPSTFRERLILIFYSTHLTVEVEKESQNTLNEIIYVVFVFQS